MWWPGISKDISDLIGKCRVCQEKQSSQTREPLLTSPLPQRPFQQMAADLCEHNGRHYLVVVDYYSRYLDICFLSKTTSQAVIVHLKKMFARHGIPETLVSDNGPQFSSSEFKAFSAFWNFQHVTTSPHFPQVNGAAERAVRTAKHILNQDDVFLALLVYRASPIVELKASPAELAYGRKLGQPSLPPQNPLYQSWWTNHPLILATTHTVTVNKSTTIIMVRDIFPTCLLVTLSSLNSTDTKVGNRVEKSSNQLRSDILSTENPGRLCSLTQ